MAEGVDTAESEHICRYAVGTKVNVAAGSAQGEGRERVEVAHDKKWDCCPESVFIFFDYEVH